MGLFGPDTKAQWLRVVGIAAALLTWACGPRVPGANEVRAELSRRATAEANGCIRLHGVEKTNGYPAPALNDVYVVVFWAEIEFIRACKWRTPMFRPGEHASFQMTVTDSAANPPEDLVVSVFDGSQAPGDQHAAGTRERVTGELGFQVTERGFEPVSELLKMIGVGGDAEND